MSTFRDLSIPYTEEETEELKEIVRGLPTYKEPFVSSADIPEMIRRFKWDRTPEQVQGYIDFVDAVYDGRLTVDEIGRNIRSWYSPSLLAREQLLNFDRDKDGFVHKDEFPDLLKVLQAHDARFKETTWEAFVEEADINEDGKVSVEECTNWIAKHV